MATRPVLRDYSRDRLPVARGIAPLSTDARIAETADQIRKRLPIAHEGSEFAWFFWSEDGGKLRQHAMRQPGIFVMHAVIWLVQQRVSKEITEPAPGHDTAGGAVDRDPHQPKMFDVFAPRLEI